MIDSRFVRITEVGPRDGLQNESDIVPPEEKIALVNALGSAGFPEIEVTSFVSPRWVPQLADAAEVMEGIDRRPGTIYSVLCPNQKGVERALEANADKISIFTAASESFCQRNLNATIEESIERFRPVVEAARAAGLPLRGYVSCAVECPYEGAISPEQVGETARRLLALADGDIEIALGETLGVADPDQIEAMLEEVEIDVPVAAIDLHLHDTRGKALSCVERALECGVRAFDSSCAGLGGCPFAPGASGNLATETLLDFLEEGGWTTNVDREAVLAAAAIANRITGRKPDE
ncbi:MAG: hydroxymethylglutaryl-CoA lyase [Phycisphaera sp. TMED9]|nr:MAG: hydroxymethylglutaryl-CoA lyase [Phycisphaera sp. TMED9]